MKKAKKNSRKAAPNKYWNPQDRELIDDTYETSTDIRYFTKYMRQLDFTFRTRFLTMFEALRILSLNVKKPVMVEIGTLRDNNQGGGHSTYKFGEYCSKFGGHLHTVDILEEAIEFSKKATGDFQKYISYHVQDSSQFLQEFDQKIDLLYLDGFDSLPGMEKKASKKQLDEIKKVFPKLSDQCVILLDDADLPKGGKTGYSSVFLQKKGFKLLVNSYQQLYVRKSMLREQ